MSAQLLGAQASLNAPAGLPGAAPTVLQGALVANAGLTVIGNETVTGIISAVNGLSGAPANAVQMIPFSTPFPRINIFNDIDNCSLSYDGSANNALIIRQEGSVALNNTTYGKVIASNAEPAGATAASVALSSIGGVPEIVITDGVRTLTLTYDGVTNTTTLVPSAGNPTPMAMFVGGKIISTNNETNPALVQAISLETSVAGQTRLLFRDNNLDGTIVYDLDRFQSDKLFNNTSVQTGSVDVANGATASATVTVPNLTVNGSVLVSPISVPGVTASGAAALAAGPFVTLSAGSFIVNTVNAVAGGTAARYAYYVSRL